MHLSKLTGLYTICLLVPKALCSFIKEAGKKPREELQNYVHSGILPMERKDCMCRYNTRLQWGRK